MGRLNEAISRELSGSSESRKQIEARDIVVTNVSGRPLTEGDLRYLHRVHGLPPDLVAELLSWPPSDPGSCLKRMMSLGALQPIGRQS